MLLALLDALQPPAQGVRIFRTGRHRGQQDGLFAVGVHPLVPIQRPALVRPWYTPEPQQHDGVELQPLGSVNGHDFDAALPGTVGDRARVIEQAVQRGRIVEIPPDRNLSQDREKVPGPIHVPRVRETGRAFQGHPGALYPACQSLP